MTKKCSFFITVLFQSTTNHREKLDVLKVEEEQLHLKIRCCDVGLNEGKVKSGVPLGRKPILRL